jgi:outer membrane receptor protein involved in Fe transport
VLATATAARAEQRSTFDIPAGPLSQAILTFANQSGVTIGAVGPVSAIQAHPVHGSMTADKALRKLLQGTGLTFERIDMATFRIYRKAPVAIAAAPPPPLPLEESGEIVVTASKRDTRIGDYPGALSILDARRSFFARNAARGTDALVDSVAELSSTNLGPGRNKLIIRGIADSSFTGPSQAIVGEYLGDVRLNYNAPDPDLGLYDMERVEVLEGPQGTLYGAGSLGGIVKLVPSAPVLGHWEGSTAGAYSTTHGAASGTDFSAMANAPLSERVAARMVAYRVVGGGYIDDIGRGLTNVNRSQTTGGRFALRAMVGENWTIDAGALVQNIDLRDGQYAESGLPPLTRSSTIAQPFDNDYRLGYITVAREWEGLQLVSATGIVDHDVTERFDATGFPSPLPSAFDQENHIVLVTNETRISHRRDDGTGWLVGTSFISNSERLTRTLGPLGAQMRITGVRNSLTGGAIYGERTFKVVPRVQLTLGGRVAYTRLAGALLDLPKGSHEESTRNETSLLPFVALSWRPTTRLTAYIRYQEGYRGGGLAVAPSGSGIVSQRFKGDSIGTYEMGLRFGDAADRLNGAVSLIYAHWQNIQADLVDSSGLPYTANIGTGRTLGAELKASWRISHGFAVEGGLFLNDSDLIDPAPAFAGYRGAALPDVAGIGGRAAASYSAAISGDINLSVDAAFRYFGPSKLGIGPGLNFTQGDYSDTSLGVRIGNDRLGGSIDATNLFNKRGNRFALGNPFGVMEGRQVTPQRPRTFRFGVDARF